MGRWHFGTLRPFDIGDVQERVRGGTLPLAGAPRYVMLCPLYHGIGKGQTGLVLWALIVATSAANDKRSRAAGALAFAHVFCYNGLKARTPSTRWIAASTTCLPSTKPERRKGV